MLINISIGIGLMIVKALEQNGAKVYIVGRRKEVLEKVAKEEAVSIAHTRMLWRPRSIAELPFTNCTQSPQSFTTDVLFFALETRQHHTHSRRCNLQRRPRTHRRPNHQRNRLHQPPRRQRRHLRPRILLAHRPSPLNIPRRPAKGPLERRPDRL